MNRFSGFLLEEKIKELSKSEEINSDDAKKAMVNQISSYFNKFVNSPKEGDVKSILLLIAALSVLNTGSSSQSINISKRLAQLAFNRSSRSSKKT